MKVALTQMDIVWEEKKANKVTCERLVREAAGVGAELIVFPELTLTGFSMNTERLGERVPGETESFFQAISKKYGIAIVFGYIEKTSKKARNIMEMVYGGSTLFKYAKIHPFSFGEESLYYEGGDDLAMAEFQGMKIGGLICYDLRFPEVFQALSRSCQVICVIASWPEARAEHWKTLLKARAIENQCFILGVNRVGEGGGLSYTHSSYVFDPYGKMIAGGTSELLYGDVDFQQAEMYRKEFQVKMDRREELYKKLL